MTFYQTDKIDDQGSFLKTWISCGSGDDGYEPFKAPGRYTWGQVPALSQCAQYDGVTSANPSMKINLYIQIEMG